MKITVTVSEDQGRRIAYFLRKKYNKRKGASLNGLCKIAIYREVREQARKDVEGL